MVAGAPLLDGPGDTLHRAQHVVAQLPPRCEGHQQDDGQQSARDLQRIANEVVANRAHVHAHQHGAALLAVRVEQDTVDGSRRHEIESRVMQLRDEPLVAVDHAVELRRVTDAGLAARQPVDEVRAARGDDALVAVDDDDQRRIRRDAGREHDVVQLLLLVHAFGGDADRVDDLHRAVAQLAHELRFDTEVRDDADSDGREDAKRQQRHHDLLAQRTRGALAHGSTASAAGWAFSRS